MNETGKVFLIDDDEPLLKALSRALKRAGYETETFRSPPDFLKLELHSGPGCILLDLMMPQMNGLEFQRTLRARDICLPVIFLTGHGDVPAASAAFKGGHGFFDETCSFGRVDGRSFPCDGQTFQKIDCGRERSVGKHSIQTANSARTRGLRFAHPGTTE